MKYIALIADIVASRDITAREPLQDKLIALLKQKGQINGHQDERIVSPYTLTLGDEFQAVFSSGEHILTDMIDINLALYPTRVRYAIGIGELTTRVNPVNALGMDGPAFHLARDALERMKREQIDCTINGLTHQDPILINATLALMNREMTKWRSNRLSVLKGLLNNRDVKALARELDISEVAIYKNIEAGNLRTFVDLIYAIERCLTAEVIQ